MGRKGFDLERATLGQKTAGRLAEIDEQAEAKLAKAAEDTRAKLGGKTIAGLTSELQSLEQKLAEAQQAAAKAGPRASFAPGVQATDNTKEAREALAAAQGAVLAKRAEIDNIQAAERQMREQVEADRQALRAGVQGRAGLAAQDIDRREATSVRQERNAEEERRLQREAERIEAARRAAERTRERASEFGGNLAGGLSAAAGLLASPLTRNLPEMPGAFEDMRFKANIARMGAGEFLGNLRGGGQYPEESRRQTDILSKLLQAVTSQGVLGQFERLLERIERNTEGLREVRPYSGPV